MLLIRNQLAKEESLVETLKYSVWLFKYKSRNFIPQLSGLNFTRVFFIFASMNIFSMQHLRL